MKSNTTKQRLQELAAINNPFSMKEAVDRNFPVKLTITVKAGDLIDMFGGEEYIALATSDPNTFKKFTDTVQDDLGDWFVGAGGNEWVIDGVESGNYDEFSPQ